MSSGTLRVVAGLLLVVPVVATMTVACGYPALVVHDQPHPEFLKPFIDSARASLQHHEDGPFRSTFSFRDARCRVDGGLLIVFDQDRPGEATTAFAMAGPGKSGGSWAGGFGVDDIDSDDEVRQFFSAAAEIECVPELLAQLQP